MNISQLVFSWPREAQYSCEPDTYESWAIEDYSLEISDIPLQVGDLRHWEGKQWQVAAINAYLPQSETNVGFNEVVLTLNGEIPHRDPWQQDDERLMYICISGEDFSFGWPQRQEFFPHLGSDAPQLEGWQVTSIHEFQGTNTNNNHYYSQVLICWCAPTQVTTSREATVSA